MAGDSSEGKAWMWIIHSRVDYEALGSKTSEVEGVHLIFIPEAGSREQR